MAVYVYRAMNPGGRVVRGEMDARNLVDLELRLRQMGLDFINGSPANRLSPRHVGRIPRKALINFCFHLEQLVRAGVPVIEGLEDLRDSDDHPRFREIVAGVIEGIRGGRTLSEALAEHPQAFNSVFCSLVRAGETSGNLPHVLRELSRNLKREDEMAAFARKIVIYPIVVSAVMVAAIAVSLVVVVPQLATLFRSIGQDLPPQTRILIAVSNFMVNYWWAVVIALVGTFAGLRIALASNAGIRLRYDRMMLTLPFVGDIRRKIMLSRFVGMFSMMYASGISIVAALRTAEDVLGNTALKREVAHVGRLIGEGRNVSSAFQSASLFPPLVTRMIRVGENTGALDEALTNVSYFYDRDVQEAIERLQALTEPLLTVVLGSVLLWIMMSVLGPVYDIITRLPV